MEKTIEIPEGYEARIEGNKVIIEQKESEDERIRKTLIDLVNWAKINIIAPMEVSDADKALDWLKARKEQKPLKLNDDTEVGLDRALQIVKDAKGKLCGYQSDDGIYECNHAIRTLERILKSGIEQKPATEWTIENAQPGDILHTWSTANSDTFIFKEIDSDGLVKCYCSYDSEDGFREGEYHYIGNKDDKYTLATPEQRIELGRRMGRAGYLFDFKTKKLIRLGSKRELIEWNLEDENMLQFYLDECEYKHDHWSNKDRVEMLAKFKDWLVNRAKYFAKPKHEWTDDDDKMAEALHNCISELIDNNGWNYVYVDDDSISLSKIKDWIDKLRERV